MMAEVGRDVADPERSVRSRIVGVGRARIPTLAAEPRVPAAALLVGLSLGAAFHVQADDQVAVGLGTLGVEGERLAQGRDQPVEIGRGAPGVAPPGSASAGTVPGADPRSGGRASR